MQPCPTHPRDPRPAWRTTTTTKQARGYGSRWEKQRATQLRDHPWCNICGKRATEVDHIRPKWEGGDDHPMNTRSLCRSCHGRKTQQDALRAKLAKRTP